MKKAVAMLGVVVLFLATGAAAAPWCVCPPGNPAVAVRPDDFIVDFAEGAPNLAIYTNDAYATLTSIGTGVTPASFWSRPQTAEHEGPAARADWWQQTLLPLVAAKLAPYNYSVYAPGSTTNVLVSGLGEMAWTCSVAQTSWAAYGWTHEIKVPFYLTLPGRYNTAAAGQYERVRGLLYFLADCTSDIVAPQRLASDNDVHLELPDRLGSDDFWFQLSEAYTGTAELEYAAAVVARSFAVAPDAADACTANFAAAPLLVPVGYNAYAQFYPFQYYPHYPRYVDPSTTYTATCTPTYTRVTVSQTPQTPTSCVASATSGYTDIADILPALLPVPAAGITHVGLRHVDDRDTPTHLVLDITYLVTGPCLVSELHTSFLNLTYDADAECYSAVSLLPTDSALYDEDVSYVTLTDLGWENTRCTATLEAHPCPIVVLPHKDPCHGDSVLAALTASQLPTNGPCGSQPQYAWSDISEITPAINDGGRCVIPEATVRPLLNRSWYPSNNVEEELV